MPPRDDAIESRIDDAAESRELFGLRPCWAVTAGARDPAFSSGLLSSSSSAPPLAGGLGGPGGKLGYTERWLSSSGAGVRLSQ